MNAIKIEVIMSRLLYRSLKLLEPYEGKLSCTVLRGGSGGNATFLPDNVQLNRALWTLAEEMKKLKAA